LNTGRIQVFDRRQIQTNETTLSSSIETLNFSSSSPILSLQYIQKNSHFHSSGLLVGSNDKSGFYEYVSNCEYHFHELPIKSKYFSNSFSYEKNFF
jgi:phosphatidylinositol kinase/protein kinase (PI-3  family)